MMLNPFFIYYYYYFPSVFNSISKCNSICEFINYLDIMIFNSFIPFFIIVFHLFIIPFSNAIPFNEDKMLIAVMKGDPKIQMSEYSVQKYEAFLGFMYFMRKNWQCDKIAEEFEKYERTKCQKHRKSLDILYEYLCREYAGIPTTKPKFILGLKNLKREEASIIYVVKCLLNISQFYFIKDVGQEDEYKLNKFFYSNDTFEPKLLNAERLNYEVKLERDQKVPINEMILQLAIETANEYPKTESLDGIIRQNFDENLKEMFIKAEKRAEQSTLLIANEITNDKHNIIIYSKFNDEPTWTKDTLFLEFVKGLATNSEKFFKMAKEYSKFKLLEFEQVKELFTKKCKAHLRVVYLLRMNWHCEKIGKEFNEQERTECQKFRKYLDILYEYLFQVYAEAKNPIVSEQLPPLVKPIFISGLLPYCLTDFMERLIEISKYFWKQRENIYDLSYISLVNEEELNFEIKEEKNWFHKIIQKGKQIWNGPTDIENLWEEFEQKMAEIAENAKENA